MIDERGNGNSADIRRHIDDLIRIMSDQNADQVLVGQCLEHLHAVLETLGEQPTARWLRKRLRERDGDTTHLAERDDSDDK